MKIKAVPIASVKSDPENAKKHPARQLEELQKSLKRFGQQKPIVVDADGVVVAGNGTLEAAKLLEWTEIFVVRTTLRGAEARAFALVDNRTPELGEWDLEILAEQLSLPDIGPVGFDADELDALICHGSETLATVSRPATTAGAPDAPPPVAGTVAQPDPTPSGAAAGNAGDPPGPGLAKGKPVKLTAEQREGLDEVFKRFRERHQTPDGFPISEGQILVLIAADWMAGN